MGVLGCVYDKKMFDSVVTNIKSFVKERKSKLGVPKKQIKRYI
jgi:hypothetical protein